MLAVRAVKLYADGALVSRGAALLAPYADAPDEVGFLVTPVYELAAMVEVGASTGWQIAVHAIGDRGNRVVLDAFAAAKRAHPGADLRFRVEHAQVLAPEDLVRFAPLGVIASMQPTHCTSDMPWAEARLGPTRTRGAYAWRALLDTGAHVAAGSDFPIEGVSPLLGVYAAVTRQDADGTPAGGWYPEQRMTLDEAIRAFTVEPAYASFVEEARGRLAPGYVADVTVFDRALVADRSLLEARAELTLVGGRASTKSAWAGAQLAHACAELR
jgi:predicted amidohydrolase YtcJ